MEALKVLVTSRVMIKPSYPTPHHLKTLQLGFLDQLAPRCYIPLILFYQNNKIQPFDQNIHSTLLKKSLSNILADFYPLAGRVEEDETCIDCSDDGVEYVEANVFSNLSNVLDNPNPSELLGLLPFESDPKDNNVALGIQMNHFSCGGLAMSVCISHKIADGTAMIDFVNAWASATTNGRIVVTPRFDSSSHFPPTDIRGVDIPRFAICEEKLVTKRFIFDQDKINVLKEQATEIGIDGLPTQMQKHTKVQIVSAFIWKLMKKVARAKSQSTKISGLIHAVNLRKRATPPILSNSFGNFWCITIAPSFANEDGYPKLVENVRDAISKIDDKYVKRLRVGDNPLEIREGLVGNSIQETFGELYNFTSWCRFPFYEVDFGWGKPTWVCTTPVPFKDTVVLLSTRCEQGIEAWVNMLEDDVALLEDDYRLL